MNPLKIGVDFDNTIASYEGVFHQAAADKKLIPPRIPTSKGAVRDYLRSIGQEDAWTELQGYVYGARMDLARPYPGVESFFSLCRTKKIPVCIISHKTRYPYLGPKYDLHTAARNWLQTLSWTPPAFFELTLQSKLDRIAQEECTVFIDDLPELLSGKTFPQNVRKILFDPHKLNSPHESYSYASSWTEILKLLNLYDS